MYGDYTGKIIVDTVDQTPTIEEYAKMLEIDTYLYKIIGIEINKINLDDVETCYFIVNNKSNLKEEFKIKFQPNRSLFREFFKRTQIIIKSK